MIEVFEGGELRKLGTMEQPVESLTCAWPVAGGIEPSSPPLSRDKWEEVDLSPFVQRVANQNGVGMCAASATVAALEICRAQAGLEFVPLSAGDLYARVAGGRDEGSLPEHNLKELMTRGIAPESDVKYLDWSGRVKSPNRERYMGFEAELCPTIEHIATQLMRGFPVELGYFHYGPGRFTPGGDPVDKDGWMDRPYGSRGGHSVCLVGLKNRNGVWGFKKVGSWTRSFGVDGYAIIPESRVAEGLRSFASWSLRCSVRESGNLPPLKV